MMGMYSLTKKSHLYQYRPPHQRYQNCQKVILEQIIKIKPKRPKKRKKGRIRKKDLNKRQSSAKKRSLAFQYTVLDLVNISAYWTSLLTSYSK